MPWMNYPAYKALRTGCKVSWYTYGTKEEAEAASKAAINNASILAEKGYDFGYQSPGAIEQNKDGDFVVVIP